jgi:DNA mismatch repair ATPase MutS
VLLPIDHAGAVAPVLPPEGIPVPAEACRYRQGSPPMTTAETAARFEGAEVSELRHALREARERICFLEDEVQAERAARLQAENNNWSLVTRLVDFLHEDALMSRADHAPPWTVARPELIRDDH